MTIPSRTTRPVLARGVRYRWDKVRQQHQLLYPEGLLVLNEAGAAIVQLCDGRLLEELCQTLEHEFANADLSEDVHTFLDRLAKRGLISDDADA